MSLEENPKNLEEIEIYSNVYKDAVYINILEENGKYINSHFHFRKQEAFRIFTPGTILGVKYLHPDHLFLRKLEDSDDKAGYYIYTVYDCSKKSKNGNINVRYCFPFKDLAEDLSLKTQPPKIKGKKSSGLIKDLEKYKFKGEIGYIVNISEFEPKI